MRLHMLAAAFFAQRFGGGAAANDRAIISASVPFHDDHFCKGEIKEVVKFPDLNE